MSKASIIFFVLGIVFIVSSFITIKKSQKHLYTRGRTFSILNRFKNSKFLSFFISEGSPSTKKLLNKIQVIIQCSHAESLNSGKFDKSYKADKIKNPKEVLRNLYILQISLFIIVTILAFIVKDSLNNMVIKETLNSSSIHELTQYKISTDDASSIINYIDNSYKHYIKDNNVAELQTVIYDYVIKNKLALDQDSVYMITDIYIKAYDEGHFNLKEIATILMLGIVSTLLVKLYINIKFKIYNVKLLSEFYSMELLALLHMNRDELNVYEILSELNKYSIYLRPYLTRCLNRYSTDPIKALDKLIKEVGNESFTSFILIFKSCLDKSKNINSEILQLQRKLRFLNDRLDNDKSIEFKQLYLTIAQFPLIIAFTLNILIPFLAKINLNISI